MGKQQAGQRSGWRVWTEAEARTVVADWKASGESGTAYGARHGFSAKRLYRWAALLSVAPSPALSAAGRFVPVRVVERGESAPGISRIAGKVSVEVGGATIHLWEGANTTELRLAVAALKDVVVCG